MVAALNGSMVNGKSVPTYEYNISEVSLECLKLGICTYQQGERCILRTKIVSTYLKTMRYVYIRGVHSGSLII